MRLDLRPFSRGVDEVLLAKPLRRVWHTIWAEWHYRRKDAAYRRYLRHGDAEMRHHNRARKI